MVSSNFERAAFGCNTYNIIKARGIFLQLIKRSFYLRVPTSESQCLNLLCIQGQQLWHSPQSSAPHEIGTSLPSHRPPLSLSKSTMVSTDLAISRAKSPNRSFCRGRVLAEAGAGLALSTAVKRIMTSLISPLARARLY